MTVVVINRAMERKIALGRCIDIGDAPRTAADDYLLTAFARNIDYCDAAAGRWIWSIAEVLKPLPSVMRDGSRRLIAPGMYLASTSSKFYTRDDALPCLKCVFLR